MIPKECKRLAEVDFPIAEVSKHAARSRVTVKIARRELREWLRESAEGAVVEAAVGRLLG